MEPGFHLLEPDDEGGETVAGLPTGGETDKLEVVSSGVMPSR